MIGRGSGGYSIIAGCGKISGGGEEEVNDWIRFGGILLAD